MKITNICAIPNGASNDEAAKYLSDCGLPDKMVLIDGSLTLALSSITSLSNFNPTFEPKNVNIGGGIIMDYEQLDTKAAAFETVNGESVLVYYNPNCEADLKETSFNYSQTKMCANFVYDLNGKKGPNTVGKDIGFITALYSTDPIIVAPNPYYTNISEQFTQANALAKCKEISENTKLPNIEELTSIFYNKKLLKIVGYGYWSSTLYSSDSGWIMPMHDGLRHPTNSATSGYLYCIKR